MIKIKITEMTLVPFTKCSETIAVEDKLDIDAHLLNYFEQRVTPKESKEALVKKYNNAVRRFNAGKAKAIILLTHPHEGVILRIIINIFEEIGKEIGTLI